MGKMPEAQNFLIPPRMCVLTAHYLSICKLTHICFFSFCLSCSDVNGNTVNTILSLMVVIITDLGQRQTSA